MHRLPNISSLGRRVEGVGGVKALRYREQAGLYVSWKPGSSNALEIQEYCSLSSLEATHENNSSDWNVYFLDSKTTIKCVHHTDT